ncbi:MAG: ABC transporter permease [Anaerolineae bacterium]|nr:ABC transporter permease [Anaerolineae bacterium]
MSTDRVSNSPAEHAPQPSRHRIRVQPERGWATLEIGTLWTYRDLLYILAMRDVKLRYKQTALGIIWVILQPLVAALIFAVIFGRFANLPSSGVPYLPFVFAGMLPWNLFSGALQRAGNSLISDSKLISKVYFPRMTIPVASSAAVLIDFAVGLVVMLVLIVLYGIPLTANLVLLPLLLLLTLLISIGVSLFFSALNVYYRDFMYALPFIVQVWMYATPVVYSIDLIPSVARNFYALNPMVGVIDGFRWALLGLGDFPLASVLLSLVIGVIVFVSGALVFQRVERNFADVI